MQERCTRWSVTRSFMTAEMIFIAHKISQNIQTIIGAVSKQLVVTTFHRGCLKILNRYDIPSFWPKLTLEELRTLRGFYKQAGIWNRRNNSKNNSLSDHWRSSMSFSSFVALGSLFRRDGSGMLFLPEQILLRQPRIFLIFATNHFV